MGALASGPYSAQIQRALAAFSVSPSFSDPTFTGQAKFADGTAAAPSITFASDTDLGWYRQSADDMVAVGAGGTKLVQIRAVSGFLVNQDLPIGFGQIGVASSALLWRDADNSIAQRNGTNAQMFRAYGTFVSAANYRRAVCGTDATDIYIGQEHAGASGGGSTYYGNFSSGTGEVGFFQAAAIRWKIINADSAFVPHTSGVYNIGSTTLKVLNYYGSGLVMTGTVAVGSLPAAAAGLTGARYAVNDSNAALTAGIGAVVAGGGANIVPVFCDGTNWRIG